MSLSESNLDIYDGSDDYEDKHESSAEDTNVNLPPVVVITKTFDDDSADTVVQSDPQWVPIYGYATDKPSPKGGLPHILAAVELLRDDGIICCMTYEAALRYYGARRALFEWIFCLPTECVEKATQLFQSRHEDYEPFRHPETNRIDSLNHFFPRFKVRGFGTFFTLVSSQALNMPCTMETIEFSTNGIPYPRLPVYAQSLIDTLSDVDLVDLIDGMDLDLAWGYENLDLVGTVDVAWGLWKANFEHQGQAKDEDIPAWIREPPFRLRIWEKFASPSRKHASRGFKAVDSDSTRFRKKGSKDPRLRHREFC